MARDPREIDLRLNHRRATINNGKIGETRCNPKRSNVFYLKYVYGKKPIRNL